MTLWIPQVIFREICALYLYKGFGFEVKAQSSIMKLLSNDSDSSRDSPEEQQLSVQQASELKAAGQILTFLNKVHMTSPVLLSDLVKTSCFMNTYKLSYTNIDNECDNLRSSYVWCIHIILAR